MKFLLQSQKKYSKNLEEILKNKNFDIEVSNLILLIFNHLNEVYTDYSKIKVNVLDKDLFFHLFFENLKDNVNKIELIKDSFLDIDKEELAKAGIKPVIKEKKKVLEKEIDFKRKSIRTNASVIELYTSLVEIQTKYFNIKDEYIFKDILLDILVEGADLDKIEILRDFKKFSWYSNHGKAFPYVKNLLYQNLLFLLGAEFMSNWETRSTNLPDYIKEIEISLTKQFGEKNKDEILNEFYASIYAYTDSKDKIKIEKEILKKKKLLESMKDSEKFLNAINRKKKLLNKKLEDIDLILNNDNLLVKAFKEKNNRLADNRKIASISIYRGILEEERLKVIDRLDFLTLIQKPKRFVEYKTNIENQIKSFDKNRKINDCIVSLELVILKSMKQKVETEKDIDKILSYLNYLRYFKFLKLSDDLYIKDIKQINKQIKEIEKILVTKACEIGAIRMLSYDIDINYDLIATVLDTRLIDLEDVLIELDYKALNVGIRIYDKNTLDKEEIIKVSRQPDLAVKLRKKTKLFT